MMIVHFSWLFNFKLVVYWSRLELLYRITYSIRINVFYCYTFFNTFMHIYLILFNKIPISMSPESGDRSFVIIQIIDYSRIITHFQ